MVKETTSFTFTDDYGVKLTQATHVFRVNEEDTRDTMNFFRAKGIPFHGYASGRDAYAIEVAEHILQGAVECDPNKSAAKALKGCDLAITTREEIAHEVIRPLLDNIEKDNQPLLRKDTLDYIGKNFTVEEATFLNAAFAAAVTIEDENSVGISGVLPTNDEEIA